MGPKALKFFNSISFFKMKNQVESKMGPKTLNDSKKYNYDFTYLYQAIKMP
ncbi:hypothetical protein J699_02230 [Acinetobacter sp. 1000160]|nr:hypothetical protein J522_1681 [Acinetobacter baumannii 146457]EYT19880.1 hypothetical protein J699_02230 [Acinetobacter sp. 1000160]